MILWQEDMAEIEAIHASIRRELFVLSTQTHTMDFMELSDRHDLRCARRQCTSYGVPLHDVVTAYAEAADNGAADASTPSPKRTKIVNPGPYRVFCSEQFAGSKKGCSLPGTGAVYAALDESEKARLQRIADNRAEAVRLGGRGFGPTPRALQRAEHRDRTKSLTDAVRLNSEIDPSAATAAHELANFDLHANTDFDDGIRSIKRGMRNANCAEAASAVLQHDMIVSHDRTGR